MREALYTNAHRLESADAAIAAGVSSTLAQDRKCHRSTLYRWKKRRDEIAAAASNSTVLLPGRRGPKTIEMGRGHAAKQSSRSLNAFLVGRSEAASIEYLRRFRLRNRLSVRHVTHKGRRKRSDVQIVADEFGHAMIYKLEASFSLEGHEKYQHLFNMDQTSIYVDMNPKTTITFQGDHDVDVSGLSISIYDFIISAFGMSENSFRASVFLCASATGYKLPPLIVFAGAKGCKVEAELRKNTLHKEDKLVLAVQKNAYCDERIMIEWIKEMSTVRAHLEDAMTDVEYVPPGATMLTQPMDVAVMAGFKRECRELYAKHHCVHYHSAWNWITPETIRRGFVMAGSVPIGPRTPDGRFTIAQPPAPQLTSSST
ncbi:hypothetical protein P3T76_007470 [Phytophthora citrophthora]|uniref:DDE-1 domain-containing protein n=1 Tax=Phytophthora citrophthora TaxID=4793 RepID=A0AAD9LN23_9STRA|nr:hypothetical protein P3T76_007470 [Phytophthora citrophthora]